MTKLKKLLHVVVVFAFLSDVRGDDNWPRFRGPNADGVAKNDPRLPDKWTSDSAAWAAEIQGWGWACPIVWGNKVFITSVYSEEEGVKPKKGLYLGRGVREPAKGVHHWMVYCLDLKTGRTLWKHEAHKGKPTVPRHPKSTYAAETPTTDGKRLYVLFGDVGLYCYSLDGKPLWKQPIEAKKTMMDYGAAASPVVYENQVFVLYDNQEDSYFASFNAETGKQIWLRKREERTTWATPYIWKNKERVELITCGKKRNRSYDLQGNVLWEFDGRMSNLVIPSPFAAHGMLYIASGYIGDPHRPVYAIKPGASGDISLKEKEESNEYIHWYQAKASPYNTSPIVYGDYYYTLYDRGFITCHDARTGKEVYKKTRFAPGASFTASPWAYNGKIYCLSEDGDTFVVQAGPEFKLLHTNKLDELCISTPAISQGRLLIRTASKVYCFTQN